MGASTPSDAPEGASWGGGEGPDQWGGSWTLGVLAQTDWCC